MKSDVVKSFRLKNKRKTISTVDTIEHNFAKETRETIICTINGNRLRKLCTPRRMMRGEMNKGGDEKKHVPRACAGERAVCVMYRYFALLARRFSPPRGSVEEMPGNSAIRNNSASRAAVRERAPSAFSHFARRWSLRYVAMRESMIVRGEIIGRSL